jgi:hypothetical protein
MRKRILVAVALLLTIAATGCRGAADDLGRMADDAGRMADDAGRIGDDAGRIGDNAGRNEPGSVQLPQIGLNDVKDAADAACRLKNSAEGNNTNTDEAQGNTDADGSCG